MHCLPVSNAFTRRSSLALHFRTMDSRRISSGSDAALPGANSAAADAAAALAAVAAVAAGVTPAIPMVNETWVASFENRRVSAESLKMTQENCNW